MAVRGIKLLAVAGAAAAFFMMCRFLLVPPLYLSLLAGWGAFCFLFSFELAGCRRRVRNGIEEKTPLQLAWMTAGLICVLAAFATAFAWF